MDFSTKLIALNSKTNGKDKIFRTIQYACKLFWYILWKSKSNKEFIEKLKKIEIVMSNTRKALRFGKTHEMIVNALNSIHLQDHFYRYVLTFCNLNQSCYLLLDNLLWLNSMNVIKIKNKEVYSKWCNKFWLFSSILYLARDFHDLVELVKLINERIKRKSDPLNKYRLDEQLGAYTSASKPTGSADKFKALNILRIILSNKKNQPLLLDTAKNVADIFLPLNSLGYIELSPGAQGLLGLISSLLSLLFVWDSAWKLKT